LTFCIGRTLSDDREPTDRGGNGRSRGAGRINEHEILDGQNRVTSDSRRTESYISSNNVFFFFFFSFFPMTPAAKAEYLGYAFGLPIRKIWIKWVKIKGKLEDLRRFYL